MLFSAHTQAIQCLSCGDGPKTEQSISRCGLTSAIENCHFLSSAGHTLSSTGEDAVGLLGHLSVLVTHVQTAVDQHPQVLSCQTSVPEALPPAYIASWSFMTQVQDLALNLVECHAIELGLLIQPIQIPLQRLPIPKQINTPT